MNQRLEQLLAAGGPLAERLHGYAPRSQQLQMAQAVAETIRAGNILITEAGTGTGKTLAYLLPALASRRKIVVSTGTRNLQEQLFARDLPLAASVLGQDTRVALLKGRANYLCPHRLDIALQGKQSARLKQVRDWAQHTVTGDIAELSGIPEDSPHWREVTSTADNCLGQECPRIGDCHVMRARRLAQDATVVVVNHHLLLADMSLRAEGVNELLPDADAFVIDEAHQLHETASRFFSLSVSSRQLLELATDCRNEHLRAGGKVSALPTESEQLGRSVQALRLALGVDAGRRTWGEVASSAPVIEALQAIGDALRALEEWLRPQLSDNRGLANCAERCQRFVAHLTLFGAESSASQVRWLEITERGFVLSVTPLEIAETFRSHRDAYNAAWIFTSATLAVDGDFRHFAAGLGLQEAATLCLDSPFDYRLSAVLYHPSGLPEPSDGEFTRALVEAAVPVIEAAGGRTFMLFTSYRALYQAADLLGQCLDYPLLVQGSVSRSELLQRFRESGEAVLLGTASFWEGVDVRGRALSCVIIDRLPFASPGDPVLAARIDALRTAGGNPFRDYQLPAAVISLKQGVGRLIRDVSDRGVMMLADPRLLSRGYGRLFLDSLPPMTRTRNLEVVQRFFTLHDNAGQTTGS